MGITRTDEFEIYVADIEHPRQASLAVYQDFDCWLTIVDGSGAQTTIRVDLTDERDRQFAVQLRQAAHVMALMAADDDEDGWTA